MPAIVVTRPGAAVPLVRDPQDGSGAGRPADRRTLALPSMQPAIQVTDLSKRFGSNRALAGMSFAVEAGQVTGFVGPNGAGKSTTMRVILGLDRPDAGQALVNGRSY